MMMRLCLSRWMRSARYVAQTTGKAQGVNDVYLYFNLGRKFERYYSRNLDDVGPDLDDGMPADRQGDLVAFVSYPGHVLVAVDVDEVLYCCAVSTIMMLNGSSWHELYRSPCLSVQAMGACAAWVSRAYPAAARADCGSS